RLQLGNISIRPSPKPSIFSIEFSPAERFHPAMKRSSSIAVAADAPPVIGPVTQLGFVVRDIEAALAHWVGVLGVRPFLFCTEGSGSDPAPTTYLGKRVRVQTRLAFGFVGDVQIEIIEQ